MAHEAGRLAFLEALDGFLTAVEPLDERSLLAASRCWGWAVMDVVTHVRLGLEEVAACLLSAGIVQAPPDHDAATYWLNQPPGDEEVAGIVAIRRLASATKAPSGGLVPLRQVTGALCRAVERLPDGVLALQGCVLTTGNFYATWAVELAVHQLDLARDVDVAPPPIRALELARRTIDALAAAELAAPGWADRVPVP